ncbi:MAG: hypothetical protein JWN34_4263, partial [Bryobacterales bacterium]|nr:hypothetical protein [Bryobacterales bacterium]
MRTVRTILLLILVAGGMAFSALAQGLTGQISGTVNDASGSAVVGAEVVLTNQ